MRGTCRQVASATDQEGIAEAYARHGLPIVLAGNAALMCDCESRVHAGSTESRSLAGATESRQLAGDTESRQLAGDTENRRLAGNTENRRLAGDTENRRLAGDTENRRLAGDTEDRSLAGDTESRSLAGDTESRQLGGDTEERRLAGGVEVLSCVVTERCDGFRVEGSLPIRVYDGSGFYDSYDRCIAPPRRMASVSVLRAPLAAGALWHDAGEAVTENPIRPMVAWMRRRHTTARIS